MCLCVCLCAAARLHYCTDPDITWGSGRGCPLVVHYLADLQSVHGLRCCGNTMEMRGRAQRYSARPTARRTQCRALRMPAKTDSPRRRENQRAFCVRRSISSILQGCYNANAKLLSVIVITMLLVFYFNSHCLLNNSLGYVFHKLLL